MRRALYLLPLAVLVPCGWLPSADAPPPAIDYARQIRPILADNCFQCHGPDEKTRKASLRLDTRAGLYGQGDTRAIVAPKKPDASELVVRLLAGDEEGHMPPKASGKTLTPAQIDLLKRWVAEGASYSEHWAFAPVAARPQPAVKNDAWVRNPIDRFVLARLEKEGLKPTPEADKARLIRRVTLDLTGLPPTPAEVAAFVNDPAPDAYEKVVERLFNNPHHGERMALDWLDASRFADTHGYHLDSGRDMTRWREYVIDSYNRNKRFDDFTIEQLAGDLLPNATLEQKVASGFNRNHMINFEGGAIPQEYLTAYIVDRVSTTATVWLGLTVACAQCHDHKYDPISQKEFYQLYAFFNQVPENGLDGSKGNAMPFVKAPTPTQAAQLATIAAQVEQVRKQLNEPAPFDEAAFKAWRAQLRDKPTVGWQVLEPTTLTARGGGTWTKEADGVHRITGKNPSQDVYTATLKALPAGTTGLRLEILPDDTLNGNGPGRSVNGNVVMSGFKLTVAGKAVPFKEAKATFAQDNFPAANAITGKAPGWAIFPEVGKAHTFTAALEKPFAAAADATLALEYLTQFAAHQPGRIRLAVTTAENPFGTAALPEAIAKLVGVPDDKLTAAQLDELKRYHGTTVTPKAKDLRDRLAALDKEKAAIEAAMPTAMVMADGAKRQTHVLVRGQYDKKGQAVTANTPAALPPLPADAPKDRLGLARWLVSPAQPLTARVTVNRYWQTFFGTGLVRTAEDFGIQGEQPSHPELLDYLASEFAQKWDTRHILRMIVTSATYRQASRVEKEALQRDPDNRLLARAPRLRLPAEFIRDQALAVSGLLDDRIGGASVNPYQPLGLWQELTSRGDSKNWSAQEFVQSHGRDLYRRSMYTFWKRTSPPPQMLTFDAPDREVCTVRRSRTNTPLQALVLMNDPTYVEASRKLAERILAEGGTTTEARLGWAFNLVTSRPITDRERGVLARLYEQQRAAYVAKPELARKLLKVGESAANDKLDVVEVATWAMVASVLLNLDETITRN